MASISTVLHKLWKHKPRTTLVTAHTWYVNIFFFFCCSTC